MRLVSLPEIAPVTVQLLPFSAKWHHPHIRLNDVNILHFHSRCCTELALKTCVFPTFAVNQIACTFPSINKLTSEIADSISDRMSLNAMDVQAPEVPKLGRVCRRSFPL